MPRLRLPTARGRSEYLKDHSICRAFDPAETEIMNQWAYPPSVMRIAEHCGSSQNITISEPNLSLSMLE